MSSAATQTEAETVFEEIPATHVRFRSTDGRYYVMQRHRIWNES